VTRGNKVLIAAIGLLIIVMAVMYFVMPLLGFSYSVIMSSSLQHDNDQSQLGVLDTGDIAMTVGPDSVEIQSYVKGTTTGYRSFGDYGSIITYERGSNENPVIHRAIVWLTYNGNGTWSSTELADYQGDWYCPGCTYHNLQGILTFTDITQSHKRVEINLDSLGRQSGFLTMGDNPVTNPNFDQSGLISHPVSMSEIKSVAMYEIPWLGVVKVYMTPEKKQYLEHVPNSIYSMIMLYSMIAILIYCCDVFHIYDDTRKKRRELEAL